jgi:TolB-like protein/DNA-binding winged helix-turn-helix (wHTH) protein/Tfp pilus assembly protein PilF
MPQRPVPFDPIELDLRRYELRVAGRSVRLERIPMELLILLVKQQDRLVTREEIVERLWGKGVFIDVDQGINSAIRKVRRALKDDPEQPRFLETVVGMGYRFIGPVTVVNGAQASPSGGDVEADAPPAQEGADRRAGAPSGAPPDNGSAVARRASRTEEPAAAAIQKLALALQNRKVLMGLGGILAAFAAVLMMLNVGVRRDRLSVRPGAGRIWSIAVLPLENLSGDPSQEYFADGMTEELITDLGKLSTVRVISRTSVMQYKGAREPLPQIARELNVDAVVEGSVVRSGSRVRITAQLIQAATDQHLWSESYEGDVRDVLAIQDQVARTIASEIRLKLTPEEQARLGSARAVNPEAYDYYLRGKVHLGRENETDNRISIEMLERAVSLDPTFARAFADLAHAYVVRDFYLAPQGKEVGGKAEAAVDKALSLSPELADVHLARGLLLWTPAHHFAYASAIREFRRAIELNPNLDEAHDEMGMVLLHIGLADQALEETQKAVAINPANTLARFRVGVALLYLGRYGEALGIFEKVPPEFNPSLVAHHTAWSLFCLGRREQALATTEEFLRNHPADEGGLVTSMQAMLFAAAGERQKAQDGIRIALQKESGFGHFHHTAYNIASAYALMNQPDPALKWLVKAAEDGLPCYTMFARDPRLDPLRTDARFVAFMAKLKERWQRDNATL